MNATSRNADRFYFARVNGSTMVLRRMVVLTGGPRQWKVRPFAAWFSGADFVPATPAARK